MVLTDRTATGWCGALVVLGCSYLAAVVVFIMSSGWPALIASALLFAHPFSLWDALCPRRPRAYRWSFVTSLLLTNLALAAAFGSEGPEKVSPWQAFVWAELAVCVFPLLLDSLAGYGRIHFALRRPADGTSVSPALTS